MTNLDRVLQFLQSIAPRAATNGVIGARAGVRPHQQVFQITKRLLSEGRIAGRQLGREWEFWWLDKATPSPHDPQEVAVPERTVTKTELATSKPALAVERLLTAGFVLSGRWISSDVPSRLWVEGSVPREAGVYAFAVSGVAKYVGVAKIGLSKRIYFYGNPGITQRTSQRLNKILLDHCKSAQLVEVYTAIPPRMEWNGLPVSGVAGLEVGLIQEFDLAWNLRSG